MIRGKIHHYCFNINLSLVLTNLLESRVLQISNVVIMTFLEHNHHLLVNIKKLIQVIILKE